MTKKVNIFGEVRAEQDHATLDTSFYEWQDYRSLFESSDRFIVVGRRGTGKSALTYRLKKDWNDRLHVAIAIAPNEEQIIGLRPIASLFGSTVSRIRMGIKVAWRYAILMEIGLTLLQNYKTKKIVEERNILFTNLKSWRTKGDNCIERIRLTVRELLAGHNAEEDRIADLARALHINRITEDVVNIIKDSKKEYVILVDRLDEGYEPDSIGVGIVNGIIYGVDELRQVVDDRVRFVVFVRDNIFRAIEREDQDFSRNLESHILRLHWDPQELFFMAAKRIRAAFDVNKESDVKSWNAITASELHGREKFKNILKLTLYRPRDLISLLNAAFYQASRQNRKILIPSDFSSSAKEISNTRYDDLGKEYESVFPGIRIYTSAFANGEAKMTWSEACQILDNAIASNDLSQSQMQHLRILSSGGDEFSAEILKSLYGIGFIGIYDTAQGNFVFSHDGRSPNRNFAHDATIMIHPCYWAALNINRNSLSTEDAEEIYDEYEITITSLNSEQRNKFLGQMISELRDISMGQDGDSLYEDWCKRAIEIAFAKQLSNVQLKPNKNAVQRRDVVATNEAINGFWKRVRDDYSTRLVVFEVKNYEKIGIEEYRQVHSYLDREYGNLGFILCRDSQTGVSKGRELEAFREFYGKNKVIVKLTASTLVTILSKLRNPEKFDSGSTLLSKILDAHITLYASGQSDVYRRKRGKRRRQRSL